MRQLATTGWLHNRLRMVAGSFLTKHLLVDWRIGEDVFRRALDDGDTAQNVGNWQWVAGTGHDAAPYFRIFSPITQSRRFSPNGAYFRSACKLGEQIARDGFSLLDGVEAPEILMPYDQ